MPETTAAGRVELYRCVRFPGQWEFDRVLIDNFAGEPTPLFGLIIFAGGSLLISETSYVFFTLIRREARGSRIQEIQ